MLEKAKEVIFNGGDSKMKDNKKFSQKMSRKYLCRSMFLPICLSSFLISGAVTSAPSNEESSSSSETFLSAQVANIPSQRIKAPDIVIEQKDIKEVEPVSEKELEIDYTLKTGYTTATINVRKEASLESDVVNIFPFNTPLDFIEYNEDWSMILVDDIPCYVYNEYITCEEIPYTSMSVSGDVRKSFMDYSAITSVSSRQYKIQSSKAYTGDRGIRMVNGRYLIAIGSFYSKEVGQYIDLVLENGTVIPCIIGDCKKDIDTMNNHSTGKDGSTAEFIIQTSAVSSEVRKSGDCSDIDDSWESPVIEVRLYNKNIFD